MLLEKSVYKELLAPKLDEVESVPKVGVGVGEPSSTKSGENNIGTLNCCRDSIVYNGKLRPPRLPIGLGLQAVAGGVMLTVANCWNMAGEPTGLLAIPMLLNMAC